MQGEYRRPSAAIPGDIANVAATSWSPLCGLTQSRRAVFPFKEINHLADLASQHFAAVYDDASAPLGELKQRRPIRFDDCVEHD
jgi:hypothetical protein